MPERQEWAPAAVQRKGLGAYGEHLAERYLRNQGFQVVARNHRTRYGEIDLIGRDGGDLVFVEVRTRRGTALGSPEESLTRQKQLRLVRLAEAYVQELGMAGDASWRIDVVAILIDGRGRVATISHYRNAVELG